MKLTHRKNGREGSRLDGILFFVVVLWLATAMLLVLFHHPRSTRARHPDVMASIIPQASTAPLFRLRAPL
jgi:hypothetical protein